MGLEQTQAPRNSLSGTQTRNYPHNEKDMSNAEKDFKILINKNIVKEKKGEARAWE